MMNTVEVENLVKKYGDFYALKGVGFKVKKGEIFAFLGPNGAGKTTTVHILTTLLKPTSGSAAVAGFDVIREAKEVRKRIGIVFQEPSVDRDLTAYENMLVHGGVYGLRGEELKRKIEELLKFVELWNFRNKLVKHFSGGMQRRLEIARSLLHEPEVLFLDEPTLGLDPQTRVHVWEYIEAMKEEHDVTIFLTTHYMDEAEMLADRVAIIDNGSIIAEGTVEKLKKLVGNDIVYLKVENGSECFETDIGECTVLPDGRIRIDVENASEAIPKIFEVARENGVKILEVKYHRPTLNDVFLHLTGREIRDESGEFFKMAIARARMRR
jgi:ABC-2 type transport system ATP-binding protein